VDVSGYAARPAHGGGKASAALATRLREAILSGRVGIGEQLPSERELAEQARMSRGSVREALQVLQAEGLIETRLGRSGGPVVRAPGPDALGRPVDTFIRGRAVSGPELVETLLLVEPAAARLAAERRTDDDLAQLAAVNERLAATTSHEQRVAVNAQWHATLGAATHNELIAGIMSGLAHSIHAATGGRAFSGGDVHPRTVASNERLRQAIEARDADAAEAAMRRHITAAVEIVRRSRGA
jgi:GntR family transcriptional regulator, transcriptional repressor for pyruvate dehydrogenase complex